MDVDDLVKIMAQRCNLEDPIVFAAKRKVAGPNNVDKGRRTGRTTKMLVEVLAAAAVGARVQVTVANRVQADMLRAQLAKMALAAGVDSQQVVFAYPGQPPQERAVDIRFSDHWVTEKSDV